MKKEQKKHDLNLLDSLLKTAMPSGYETINGSRLISNYFKELGLKPVLETKLGTIAYKQGNGPKSILISAHYDEIGFQIQHINSNGLINIVSIGGLDKKVLAGQVVEIYRRKQNWEPLLGVIGKKPIHAEDYEERTEGSSVKISDYLVDIGAKDKEEAQKMVSIGDFGVIKVDPIYNLGDKEVSERIMARALDDKIGMYAVCQIAKLLSKQDLSDNYTIIYAGFPQEETGLRGAHQARNLNPDVSIDIDVKYTTDDGHNISEAKNGTIELGKGPVINHGVDKNYSLNDALIKTAEKENISYQEIVTQDGRTNTDVIQLFSKDCETTHVSIGIRNLHTPVEICDWNDIEGTIDLICKIIENRGL